MGGNPLFVIKGCRRGRRVDERRRAPRQVAAAIEGAPVHRHGIWWRGAVKAKSGIVNGTAAIEGQSRIATSIVGATSQVFHAGDQGAQVRRVGCCAAPMLTPIVREVGARVAITQCATRGAVNGAAPCARHIVVGRADDGVGVVRIHRDVRLVL